VAENVMGSKTEYEAVIACRLSRLLVCF